MVWTDKILAFLKMPAEIRVHENKSAFLKVEKRRGKLRLHVHRLFENAPTPVLEALAQYAAHKDLKARAVIRQMAHLHFAAEPLDPAPLLQAGTTYDLQEIYERVKKRYFKPDYQAFIGWSDRNNTRAFRSITFGCYDRQSNQIRIHRHLDHPEVPLYFIEFIVYHEMLHAIHPPRIDRLGRAQIHTPEFREKERQFAHFNRAKEWGKKSLELFKKRKKSHGRA